MLGFTPYQKSDKRIFGTGFTPYQKSDRGIFGTGFTVIELLVSVSIFALINTVILAKYNQFNAGILLTDLAYEIALSVREAQVYGLGARETTPGSANFNASYGTHFTYADNKVFDLFYDLDGSGGYTDGELLENKRITQGNSIADLCVTDGAGGQSCASTGGLSRLDVIFTRPNPDAIINTNVNSNYTRARITVTSPQGGTRTVLIERTGQISVN